VDPPTQLANWDSAKNQKGVKCRVTKLLLLFFEQMNVAGIKENILERPGVFIPYMTPTRTILGSPILYQHNISPDFYLQSYNPLSRRSQQVYHESR
jgi:hypothetical protein